MFVTPSGMATLGQAVALKKCMIIDAGEHWTGIVILVQRGGQESPGAILVTRYFWN